MLWRSLPIFEYHNIAERGQGAAFSKSSVDPQSFRNQMQTLSDTGFYAVTLAQAYSCDEHIRRQTLSRKGKPFVLTFDDGYADTFDHAYPILNDFGWKATVFCCPGLMNASSRVVPERFGAPLMSYEEMKILSQTGWDIGGHTMNHPELPSLSVSDQRNEIVQGKETLESILNESVMTFAYPRGMFTAETVRIVREAGFCCAVSVIKGNRHFESERFALRRIFVRPDTQGRKLLHRTGLFYELGHRLRQWRGKEKDAVNAG